MRSKLIAPLMLASALAASAPFSTPAAKAQPSPEAADQTLGMAILTANIAQTGDILNGAGVSGAVRNGTGVYTIEFARDVNGCTPSANALGEYAVGILGVTGYKVGIGVYRIDDGAFTDRLFYLTLFCPR